MNNKKIKGVLVPIMTPFNKDESINEQSLRKLVNYLMDSGVHGFIPTAATGEFPALSHDERKRVWDIVLEEVDNKLPVMPCVSANTTKGVLDLAKYAEKNGAAGVMVTAPYYFYPIEDELVLHFKTLAESIGIPVMIYNSIEAKVDLNPQYVSRLAEIDNIKYLKEGTSLEYVREVVRLAGDKITVFAAAADFIVDAFRVGSNGWITAMQNFIPTECVNLVESALKGDYSEAEKIFVRSVKPIYDIIQVSRQKEQIAKVAANYVGLNVGETRKPYLVPDQKEVNAMKKVLDSLKPDIINF